jgi:hypothetical protein
MEKSAFVTPQAFTDAFLGVVAKEHEQLVRHWLEFRPYTRLMLDEVLPAVATKLSLEAWPKEYYYLDSVFYKEKDTEHFREEIMNVKFIEVAIEHEHVLAGTEQEVIKLQLFNCPLKVLITYDANDNQRQSYIKKYSEIVAASDIFEDASTLRRQLIIFGRKNKGEFIQWNAYQYAGAEFTLLKSQLTGSSND